MTNNQDKNNKSPDNGAFPHKIDRLDVDGKMWSTGLTKREYFATETMKAIMTVWNGSLEIQKNRKILCGFAIDLADDLIEALNNDT